MKPYQLKLQNSDGTSDTVGFSRTRETALREVERLNRQHPDRLYFVAREVAGDAVG